MRLKSKKALVTGAGSHGIGKEIALAFAREGADVALHHFNHPDIAAEIATEIRALGRSAHIVEADISDPAAGRRMVRDAIALLGDLDILVANAGVTLRKPFLEFTDAEWDYIHAINLRGYFLCAQEACRDSGGAGRRRAHYFRVLGQPETGRSLYGALLRLEGRRHAARCGDRHRNGAPSDHLQSDLTGDDHLGSHPQCARRRARETPCHAGADGAGRPVGECAGAAMYFASDEFAFVTGSSIYIDGGRHVGAGQSWQVTF